MYNGNAWYRKGPKIFPKFIPIGLVWSILGTFGHSLDPTPPLHRKDDDGKAPPGTERCVAGHMRIASQNLMTSDIDEYKAI